MTIEHNVLFSGTNYTDRATISAGATVSGFDVSFIQTDRLWEFCRFASLFTNETYLVYEFSETLPLQLFGVIKHNISAAGKWRIRAANTVAEITSSPLYDSGWVKLSEALVGYGTLPWGEWDWGEVLSEDYFNLLNKNSWHIAEDQILAKVVRFDFNDENENEDGYIQLARTWIGPVYQPSFNALYGAQALLIDKSKVNEAESGTKFYGTRYLRRALSISLDLPNKELLYNVFGPIYAIGGVSAELVAILRPQEPYTFLFEAVYGSLKDVEGVKHSSWDRLTTDFYIDERV